MIPLVGLLAGGCGGSDGGDNESEGTADATTAQSSCYEGERLTFVVSFGPGGGYDVIARAAAPYLEEELGATVVVENQEGAGGLTAANRLFTAEPDGRTIGFFSGQGLVGAVLGGSAGATFDPEEFTYVARLASDPRLLTVGANSEFKTVQDLQAADTVRFASAGPGGSDHIDATVLFPVLGIDGEIITGFGGGSGTQLAVTRGDADAASGTVSGIWSPVESGDHIPVLLIGEERIPELPDVPSLLELDLAADERALAEAHIQMQDVGRAVLAPPGVPENCAAELADAFEALASDPDFLAEMEQLDQSIDYLPGDELKQVVQSVLQAPAEYKELLAEAFQGQ